MIVGKDHVSLTVRKEDLIVGEDGVLKSPLAAAIVRPPGRPLQASIIVTGRADAYSERAAPFIQYTFGTGPLRRLVLDVVKLREIVAALKPDEREVSLSLLNRLVQRATELNLERPPRPPVSIPLHAPVRRAPKPAPRPVEPGLAPAVLESGMAVDEHGVEAEAPAEEIEARVASIEAELPTKPRSRGERQRRSG